MEIKGYGFENEFNHSYSIELRKIIRKLSENSRASISEISKFAGISRKTASEKINRLQEAAGMAYTLSLNQRKLGFNSPHLVLVKFKEEPDWEEIKKILSKYYIPQVAFSVKGTYSMAVYANALSSREYAHWDKSMQILLSDYGVEWKASEVVHRQLGYFPIRNEALSLINIKAKYKSLLLALNSNSRISFQELSKLTGMHFNTVAYNMGKLQSMGYIEEFTISMQPQKSVSIIPFFAKYNPMHGYEADSSEARKAFMEDDKYSFFNRYVLCVPLIGSYDFFTMGVFDNYKKGYENDVLYHQNVFRKHNVKMEYGEVQELLLGRLPLRSVDVQKEYKMLRWNPDSVPSGGE